MKRFLAAAAAALALLATPAAMAQSHGYQTRGDYGRGYSVERHNGGYGQCYGGYQAYGHDRYERNRGYNYRNYDRGYSDGPCEHGRGWGDRRW